MNVVSDICGCFHILYFCVTITLIGSKYFKKVDKILDRRNGFSLTVPFTFAAEQQTKNRKLRFLVHFWKLCAKSHNVTLIL